MAEDFLTEAFIFLQSRWKTEDSLQDAFLRLWGKKYKTGSLPEAIGLLSRTGKNIEIDHYRKSLRQKKVNIENIPEESQDEEEYSEIEQLFRKVETSLEEDLTALQKEIIRLHEYEGKTFEQIATSLGMQPAAVRMQASRARKAIREKFRNDYEKDR